MSLSNPQNPHLESVECRDFFYICTMHHLNIGHNKNIGTETQRKITLFICRFVGTPFFSGFCFYYLFSSFFISFALGFYVILKWFYCLITFNVITEIRWINFPSLKIVHRNIYFRIYYNIFKIVWRFCKQIPSYLVFLNFQFSTLSVNRLGILKLLPRQISIE